MPRHFLTTVVILAWWLPSHAMPIAWPVNDETLANTTEKIQTIAVRARMISLSGVRLASPIQVSRFYRERGYKPAWVRNDGILLEAAELLSALQQSEMEGLPVKDYPVNLLEHYLYGSIDGPAQLAQLDVLLTDAFLHYSRNVRSGRFSPQKNGKDWLLPYIPFDGTELLAQTLKDGSMKKVLADLPPANEGYRRLRKALQKYRAVASHGGWPQIGQGETLRIGSREQRVVQLRERLRLSGDYNIDKVADPELYDAALCEAVAHYQRRHGLQDDGDVGKVTLATLNQSIESRIRVIEANMERWRWLPREMPPRYIMVNMAGYELDVIKGAAPVMAMRVIVGRNYRQTPVFASAINTLILNPSWYVPPTIFREDILPQLIRNPGRLERLNLRLYENGNAVDPHSIDWSTVNPDRSPYILWQEPGPKNPLGRIKFQLLDSNGIYMHDTPDHHLFDKPERALSSGCIRLEHPVMLALYLLNDPQHWTRDSLEAAINTGKTIGISLPEAIPIYLTYWTAWVDETGDLQFREDVYHRDRRLLRFWRKIAT